MKTILKSICAALLAAVLITTLVLTVSCSKTADNSPIRVLYISGPTGIGLAKLVSDKADNAAYNFKQYDSPTLVRDEVIARRFDIAVLPTNLAANLYNKGEPLQIAAINTLGVLYILENGDTLTDITSLAGKTVYTAEQGSTPEYVLRHILAQNGITANIEFLSDFNAVGVKAADSGAIVMLPEPKATATLLQNSGAVKIKLDLTAEWNKVSDTELVQGCIVVRKEFAQKRKADLDAFLALYKASIEFIAAPENLDAAAALVAELKILPSAGVAKQAIGRSNIVYIDDDAAETALNGLYAVLFAANKDSIGGKLPDDGIYYRK